MTIPLCFQFRTPVYGRGFVADVRIRGRITRVEEYGSTCIYGVNPGGLAAGGEDVNSAYLDFKSGLAATLFDLAKDANTFREFKAAAQDFIAATDDESVAEWESAARPTGQSSGGDQVPRSSPFECRVSLTTGY